MNTRASGVVLAIVLVLSAVGSAGCGGTQSPPDLHVPGVATPSPADAALEQADLTRACHLAATGLTYGRHVKQVADGAGRLYQVALPQTMASGAEPASQPFFDPEAFGHPVTWLNEIACATDTDRIAVAYDVPNESGDPEGDPWLVVLDGAGQVVAERALPVEAGPAQLSLASSGESLGWIGMDGAPWLWSWSSGDEPVRVEGLELRAVSGAPGGGIVWTEDGRFVAYTAWSGIGVGGAEIALARAEDGRIAWRRALDGDVLAWFDEGGLAWATAPWRGEGADGALIQPTSIELWRMDVPVAKADSDTDAQRVDVLELTDEEAVQRWFVERW